MSVLVVVVLSGACAQGVGDPLGGAGPRTSAAGPRLVTASSTTVPTSVSTAPSPPGTTSRVPPRRTDDGAPVVTRVRAPITINGNVHLDPPPPGPAPGIGATAAFATARRSYGDPRGTRRPWVALTSYTDSQGQIQSNGSVRLFHVRRLTWAVVDYGFACRSSGGPARPSGAPSRPPEVAHACLSIVFIDAHTGEDLGALVDGGPAVHDISPDALA